MKQRGVGANSALAFAGDAATKLAGIAALAVAARQLSTGQFALLGASLAAVTILTAVFDGGLSTLIARDGSADTAARHGLLRSGLIVRAPLLALALGCALPAGALLGQAASALLVVAVSSAGALCLVVLAVFRAAQDLSVEAVQKSLSSLLLLAGVLVAAAVHPSAATILLAYGLAQAVALAVVVGRTRLAGRVRRAPSLRSTVRAAAPFALMTVATLVYYRSGTLLLAALRPAADTAAFTIASTISFGLLVLPNAITTGLLPNLSAARTASERTRTARRGLAWTVALCAGVTIAVAVTAGPVLHGFFGGRYDGAVAPLRLLLLANLPIAVSGVLGTVLVAARRVRPIVVQVAVAVAVNLLANAMLIPAFGATGAAAATLVTEVGAVAILALALRRELPELLLPAPTEGETPLTTIEA